jgi:hypothetical protein
MESGGGGGAGGTAATGLGAAGTAAAAFGVRRNAQPASNIAMQTARMAWVAFVLALRFIWAPSSDRDRQADRKRGTLPRFAGEIDCTIVQLDNPERHGKADSRSLFACSEV